jgi:hypothetical protein
MGVTREQLYGEVWAEPMIEVAARYELSSNYLARVCAHLNVPWPRRGYWAQVNAGKTPGHPQLPAARPGETLEWAKGDPVPRDPRPRPGSGAEQAKSDEKTRPQDLQRHVLVAAVHEDFEKCRLSEVGYLRPLKRNLVDVFVSQGALDYALDTADQLFRAFEDRGYRVMLALPGEFRRPALALYQGQKFDQYTREPWSPPGQSHLKAQVP